MSVLDYMRAGHDTMDVARILSITEAEAYNRMSYEREWRRKQDAAETDKRKRRERARIRRIDARIAMRRKGLSGDGKFLYAGAE